MLKTHTFALAIEKKEVQSARKFFNQTGDHFGSD
jgi:hypothetical protein